MEYFIESEQDMHNLVIRLLSNLKTNIIALQGDLGSGKTTFTKALAQALGITEHVTSPTFVIQKSYSIPLVPGVSWNILVHIDAYRLEGARDAWALNLNETLRDAKNLVVIEWPECITGAVPESAITLHFEHVSEGVRRVTIGA